MTQTTTVFCEDKKIKEDCDHGSEDERAHCVWSEKEEVPLRISRKENSDSSACGHPLQDLNHLLLDCPASEPLRKSIFGSSLSILDLRSRPWGVARLLGLRGVPPRPHPSEGVG